MRKNYSDKELRALRDIIREYGHLSYDSSFKGFDIEKEFESRTGSHRASGPLYMAAWRIEKGQYSKRGINV